MIPVSGTKPEKPTGIIVQGGEVKASNWRERVREIVFPVWDDGQGLYVFDADGKMLLQIRGWGGLTSSGVPDAEAADIQAQWGKFIAKAINEYGQQQGLWTTDDPNFPPETRDSTRAGEDERNAHKQF